MSFRLGFVAAGLSLLMAACTSPPEGSSNDVVTTQGKLLAFSLDTTVDQFTHMSCTNMPTASGTILNTSAYFTYRIGAYNGAGLTLNDAFYTTLKKYNSSVQAEILAASPANDNTVLQLAMRSRQNYQNVYSKTSGSPTANVDYYNMLTNLGSDDIAQVLVANPAGGRIKQIRNGQPGGYRLEGSLYFMDNAAMVQSTRDFLQGVGNAAGTAGVLAITYTNGSSTSARSQADTVVATATPAAGGTPVPTVNNAYSVWGRAYFPVFGKPSYQPSGVSYGSTYPSNVVTSFTEQSMDGSSLNPAPQWICPTSMQLRIVRPADLGQTGTSDCVRASDPANPSPELKLLRNTLRVEDWYIDLPHHCLISKHVGQTDCYGTVTSVKYADTCSTDPTTGFSNCVQWASTCYRAN